MPGPSSSLATLRPDLAASFQEFSLEMNAAGFIGAQVCPILTVAEAFGNFGRLPLEELLQTRLTSRQVTGGYNRSNYRFKPDTFSTFEHGLEEEVDDKEEQMYGNYFDVELITAQRCFYGLLQAYELRVANLMTATGTFNNGAGVTGHSWNDHANADPVADVLAAAQTVHDRTGIWPNSVVMTRKQFRNCRQAESVIDRIKFWGGDDPKSRGISRAVLADLFDVENVHIANAVQNTAHEGQSASLSSIWPDDTVIVGQINDSRDVRMPTIARTFHWPEDGGDINGVVEMYRDEHKRCDVIRCRHQTGEKVMYSNVAQLITGLNA